MGYSLWGCKESDTTERLHFLLSFFRKKENPQTGLTLCVDWEFGMDMHTWLCFKVTNKDLLKSTGNSAQYCVVS